MSDSYKKQSVNNPSFFPELNLYKLQGLAKSWVLKYPMIQRIVLYQANKETISAEYVIFVQILYRFQGKLNEADDEIIKYLNWTWENARHVIDQLKSAYKIKTTDLSYKDEWMWLNSSIEDPPPTEFILIEPYWVLFEEMSLALRSLITEAKPEIEKIYSAIKKEIGFSAKKLNATEEGWQKAALAYFDEKSNKFSFVKRVHLEDKNLYAISPGQEPRDFNPTSCFFMVLGGKTYELPIVAHVISIGYVGNRLV